MNATAVYTMSLPASDASLLRSLAKRFGWTAKRQHTVNTATRPCELDKALHEYECGNVKEFDSIGAMMDYLNS